MKLWRCINPKCDPARPHKPEFDFTTEGDAPAVCPRCGADIRAPGGELVIFPRAAIHLLVGGAGHPQHIACRPDAKDRPKYFTPVTVAVTCPLCQATEAFAAVKSDARVLDDNEVKQIPIGVKLTG
jgi:hypothetical protein